MNNEKILPDSERVVQLAVDANIRAKNCGIDIKNALKRWNCRLNPVVEISNLGIKSSFQIIPMETLPNDIKIDG